MGPGRARKGSRPAPPSHEVTEVFDGGPWRGPTTDEWLTRFEKHLGITGPRRDSLPLIDRPVERLRPADD